jgi:hypothetical protein
LAFSRTLLLAAASLSAVVACAPPRIATLPGTIAPARRLPAGELPPGHRKLVFLWELKDADLTARGEGVARIAPPDSVRLDFFLGGGTTGGAATLVGDSLAVPGPDASRRLVPPPALLWAALGRLRLPAERDTVIAVQDSLVRADIGAPVRWRVTFRGDSLARLERIAGGRLREWVDRGAGGRIVYRDQATGRSLTLDIQRSDAVPPFDPAIWRF